MKRKEATFLINSNFRLNCKYFQVNSCEVDEGTLCQEASLYHPDQKVYKRKGKYVVLLQQIGNELNMLYSKGTCWDNIRLQKWLREAFRDAITAVAEQVLPARVHYWEEQKGLKATSVKVKKLRNKTLGQCTFDNKIELSPKILIMPERMMDSVILHEMAHFQYKHHRSTFWKHLSMLLGEDAKVQKKEMDRMLSKTYCYLGYLMK